jgi:hypothetical protein
MDRRDGGVESVAGWRAEVGPGEVTENERLRKAVSDLTLDKLVLREAVSGNF